MNTIETLLVLSWFFGAGVIIYIVGHAKQQLNKKDNCKHKHISEHVGKRKTVITCLDCKSKLKKSRNAT